MRAHGGHLLACWRAGIVMAGLCMTLTGTIPAQGQAGTPCTASEFHQLDFWSGDWDTFDVAEPDKVVARNHVSPMLGGCALREVYEQNDGLRGESFSAWDGARKSWHQSWVTNRGTILLLDGRFESGRMVLTGADRGPDGRTSLLRGTWWAEGKNVREKAERSTDGGKTWAPVFDLVFRPHPSS